ncbi:GAF and ANTAR domain-containing protein [Streptomyces sp. TRM66268-LWL]|uniref:GAF and ANTAR domain-containing protein n=1 Tax=Streptomyces polyasparticus TaxID=2767826 RepID=A0ABR7SK43_9ACTN|nr:GAF and ANTAR domain-containing protein [Streptomyces polyasparticus]MBC9714703.1 GAF and ANTAR domain-containing protein [Streptomyces polyasparticus]
MNREQQLAEAFVGLTDTLAEDFDPVMLLDRLARHCVDLAGADAAGTLMGTARGGLRTMSASDGGAALCELLQLQIDEGPCLDTHRTGRPVDAPGLPEGGRRWPQLTPLLVRAGYRSVHALPLRVDHTTIGAVGLLLTGPDGMPADDLRLAQALADVAAMALFHYRPEPVRSTDVLTRAQAAVAAKATVDMATGMLAEFGGLQLAEADRTLRAYSHRHGARLTDTAQALVRRELAPGAVLSAVSPK